MQASSSGTGVQVDCTARFSTSADRDTSRTSVINYIQAGAGTSQPSLAADLAASAPQVAASI